MLVTTPSSARRRRTKSDEVVSPRAGSNIVLEEEVSFTLHLFAGHLASSVHMSDDVFQQLFFLRVHVPSDILHFRKSLALEAHDQQREYFTSCDLCRPLPH